MAEGRERAAWSRTSGVLAMLYNANRSPRDPHREPGDFDPYTRMDRRKRPADGMNMAQYADAIGV